MTVDVVRCGRCSVKLADLVDGPLERFVAERGGPAVDTHRVARDQRAVIMLAGYMPRERDGLWVLTSHAQQRVVKAKQDGESLEPEFGHGGARNGIVDFPARVLCFRCGEIAVVAAPA